MKRILNILVLFSIVLTIFMPITNIKASSDTYSVVSIKSDGSVNKLGSFDNYSSAFNKLKSYSSTVNDVAVIRKNGKIVYASYGIFRPSTSNSTVNIYSQNGSYLSYISPSYDSDTLFLDYNPNTNMVKIMISGLIGWISLDKGSIYPISYLTDGESSSYDVNKKYVKILYPNGIRLREGPGTEFKQVGCNGANTCSSSDGGIWATGGSIYEWLNYGSVTNDGTNDWYKVNINGNIGYIANEVATNDLEEYNPNIGNKQDFNTYYYVNSSGELYHRYYATVASSKVWSTRLGKAPLYLKQGVNYYSFDGNYFYDDFTKMVNDLRNGIYDNAVNKMPYYNYYEYLPTRTKTHYNAENLNSYIGYDSKINRSDYYQLVYDDIAQKYKWTSYGSWSSFPTNQSMLYGEGESFITSQEQYGVNASQTLALAINESGWGRSYMAVREYNIFGHGAFDSAPDEYAASYESVSAGIMAHAFNYIAKDYANPLTGSHYYGSHYGNKLSGNNVSYASDAYWGEKMAGNYYSLDKYFGFQDFSQRAVLGMKQTSDAAPVYKEPTTSSTKYYNLKGIPNIPVTILDTVIGEEINGNNVWYKIQSDLPIDENRDLVDLNLETYNFDTSYAYVHSSYIYKESSEPVIYASDIVINSGTKFDALSGVTAYDAWDGDVTSKIEVSENNVNTSKAGNYTVTYKVIDSENNEALKNINVKVLSSLPVIEASDKTINLNEEFNPLDGVSATDLEDGNLTDKITVLENNVDISNVGQYTVTYSVKDNDENETNKTISVTVTVPNYKETDAIFYLDYIKNVDGKLQIKGFNTINGINNDLNTNIKYDVEFVNIDTQQSFVQHAIRITDLNEMSRPVLGLDEKDYTYSWFKIDIDLNGIPSGNYKMNIISKNNEYISTSVISNKLYKQQDTSFIGDKYVITKSNFDDKNGAIELTIRDTLLAEKNASPEYNQYDTYRIFEFNESNLLHLKGVSYSFGMDLGSDANVTRRIIFEDLSNYQNIYTFDLDSTDGGLYDVSLPVDDNLSKNRAWYDKIIDISDISEGRYVIYITTSSNITDISEFTEKLNRQLNDVNSVINGKKFSFEINNSRGNRIELVVEKI